MSVAKAIRPTTEREWRELLALLKHNFTLGPVDELDLFVGRIELITKVEDAVGLPGRHAIIYGDRGVGKSSFANLLADFLPSVERVECVKRLASSQHKFATLWHDLLDSDVFGGKTAKQILGDTQNPTDVVRLLEAYPKTKKTVFIIDEFDRIRDKKAKLLLSDLMKNVSDNLRHITIVLVGIARDIDELFENHASLPRSVQQIYMPHMEDEELQKIITDRLPPLGFKMTASVRDTIVAMSDGFPGVTHLITLNTARAAVKRRSVEIVQADLDAALREAVKDTDAAVKAIYEMAVGSARANQYRQVLAACAIAKSDEKKTFGTGAIVKPLAKILDKPITTAVFAKNLDKLCHEDRGAPLVRLGTRKNYSFYFREPLLRPFAIMKGLADGYLKPQHVR